MLNAVAVMLICQLAGEALAHGFRLTRARPPCWASRSCLPRSSSVGAGVLIQTMMTR
jgi:hypothetical protein